MRLAKFFEPVYLKGPMRAMEPGPGWSTLGKAKVIRSVNVIRIGNMGAAVCRSAESRAKKPGFARFVKTPGSPLGMALRGGTALLPNRDCMGEGRLHETPVYKSPKKYPPLKLLGAWACLALLALLLVAAPAGAEWKVAIIKVIDGDSLVLRYLGGRPSYGYQPGQRVEVRLQGIDAPEYRQAGGRRAARALAEILARGEAWSLEPVGRDRYGRVLGMLYVTGSDGRRWVNLVMVQRGRAWVYRRYTRDKRLKRAEQKAREKRLGLWVQDNPEPPWDYRARQR